MSSYYIFFLLPYQMIEEFFMNTMAPFSMPVHILIGGNNQSTANESFHGHITCVQVYDIAMDTHVIKAANLCPSAHGIKTNLSSFSSLIPPILLVMLVS